MIRRLAAALAALFVLGAIAATFAPASPSGLSCGSWLSPEYDRDEVADLVGDFGDISDNASDSAAGLSAGNGDDLYDIAADASAQANQLVFAFSECQGALSTRRTIALGLLAAAVVVPVGVLFVGGSRRVTPEA